MSRRPSRRELVAALDDHRVRAEADAETVRGLHAGLRQAGEEIADLHARAERLAAERDAAVLAGQRAARALLDTVARERAERTSSLLALAELLTRQPALSRVERPALPVAERAMPELLPSGQHAVVGGHPGLLLQLDDWISGPLPAGTNGTGSG